MVGSTASTDTLVNSTGANGTFNVNATDAGDFATAATGTALTFSAVENLTGDNTGSDTFNVNAAISNLSGLGGNDSFKINTGGSTGTIDGGTGIDHLDYSGNTAPVTVTVTSGSTGKYNGTATSTGGFSNINDVVGSTASTDTLVNSTARTAPST